ncbi:MAG: carboxypeptidase regulatory-like domain-containing protein [Vicinamibacterales bacterium]
MRLVKVRWFLALALLLTPLCAYAQTSGSIAGEVKDATGGVLPGVTVEVASPALIEKVRSAVSDGSGLYKITDLRPGTYSVTFSLAGFSTVKREGIDLSAGFTANITAEMKVGSMEETIVVSGQAPVVDVQNVREQRVLTRDIIDAIPTAKSIANLAVLIPGMNVLGATTAGQDVGGSSGEGFQGLTIHGGRRNDQQTLLDGMSVAMVQAFAGSIGATTLGDQTIEQTILSVSGHSAEWETGGVVANMLPKQGGNKFGGGFFANIANESTQSNNYTDELKARGLTAALPTKEIRDINPSFGGPLKKDKLWFFTAYRDVRVANYTNQSTRAPNLNPTGFTYVPDLSVRPYQDQITKDGVGRVTWQLTPKNKLAVMFDWNDKMEYRTLSGQLADEANYIQNFHSNIIQTTYSAPLTNRFLVEAGMSLTDVLHTIVPRPGAIGPTALESTTGQRIRAVVYGAAQSPQVYRDEDQRNDVYRVALSYVTGSHGFKFGFQQQNAFLSPLYEAPADYELTLVRGVPNSVTFLPTPFRLTNYAYKSSAFAQDQWSVNRVTMNLGVRWDRLGTRYPDYDLKATNLLPARQFSGAHVFKWNDFSPRLGASWDVFGNGKTAVKVAMSRYVLQETMDLTRVVDPTTSSAGTLTRTFADANGDFVPQGDPLNPAANGELGPSPNQNFGRLVRTLTYDPKWAEGVGVRTYNWEFSTGIQQEVRSGMSANVAFYRRHYGNFTVTDNTLVSAENFDPFCITAPSNSRLPNGGGQQICGMRDLNPSSLGRLQNLGTLANDYGKQVETWQGVDMALNTRLKNKATLQGGFSFGRSLTDNCEIFKAVPEAGTTGIASPLGGPYCRQLQPYQKQVKVLGSYNLPWALVVSGTFQSVPGAVVSANAVANNTQIAPSLGRNLSAGATATTTINLISPNTVYGDRINQIDMRFTRVFKIRTASIRTMLDLYNLANRSTVVSWNNTYGALAGGGATWLTPLGILPARLIKLGVQLDF